MEPDDVEDLVDMLRRFGNRKLHQVACLDQNTVALRMPAEGEDNKIPPAKQRFARPIPVDRGNPGVDVVNVTNGGAGKHFGTHLDQGPRPAGAGQPKRQGKIAPKLVAGTPQLSLAEVDLHSGGGDTFDNVMRTLEEHGSFVGAWFARALVDPQLDEPSSNVALGATSMVVQDAGGYIVSATCEVRKDSDGSLIGEFAVADVELAFDGSATILFDAPLTFAINVSQHSIFLKGQGVHDDTSASALTSIADAVDSTLDLYGLDEGTEFPAGLVEDVGGAWSNEDGKNLVSILRTQGRTPTHWLTSFRGRDKIVNGQIDNVRFLPGRQQSAMDPYADAQVPEFDGLPIVACPRQSDTVITLGNFDAITLREHIPYGPRAAQGTAKAAFGRGGLQESEDTLAAKLKCTGWYNGVITNRRAFAQFINVT
jgi:hypothetical protein